MKIHTNLDMNGRIYEKGSEVPWYSVYPFFLFHMLAFGGSGFFLAYGVKEFDTFSLYMHGGIAITAYTIAYLCIFGLDEVKWMFINAGLGLFGIYSQIDWILSFFGKRADDFPWNRHVIPFLYFVLYTFLVRHALLDLTQSRENQEKRKKVNFYYVVTWLSACVLLRIVTKI